MKTRSLLFILCSAFMLWSCEQESNLPEEALSSELSTKTVVSEENQNEGSSDGQFTTRCKCGCGNYIDKCCGGCNHTSSTGSCKCQNPGFYPEDGGPELSVEPGPWDLHEPSFSTVDIYLNGEIRVTTNDQQIYTPISNPLDYRFEDLLICDKNGSSGPHSIFSPFDNMDKNPYSSCFDGSWTAGIAHSQVANNIIHYNIINNKLYFHLPPNIAFFADHKSFTAKDILYCRSKKEYEAHLNGVYIQYYHLYALNITATVYYEQEEKTTTNLEP